MPDKTDFTERIDRTKTDLTKYLTGESPKLLDGHVSHSPIGTAIQQAKTNGMPDEKKQGLVEQLTALKISMAVEWESNPRWGKADKRLNKWITDACLLQNKVCTKEALKAATADGAQHNEDNDEEDLDEKERPRRSGQWQAGEQQRFLAALHRGLGSAAISACVGSRDETQVRSHTQQYLKSLQKKQQGTPEAVKDGHQAALKFRSEEGQQQYQPRARKS